MVRLILASVVLAIVLCIGGCPAGTSNSSGPDSTGGNGGGGLTGGTTGGTVASNDSESVSGDSADTTGGAGGSTATGAVPSDSPAADAILVSIVMHFEEPPGYPDFENDPAAFEQYRGALLQFANMLAGHKVAFDFQSDWNFLKAVAAQDVGEDTGGLNIVRYLHDTLGFSVDPHAHETQYNYADVAYLLTQVGVEPTGVVGGFIADPPQSSLLEQFWTTISGREYPQYSWSATVLWGGGSGNHVDESALWTSGVWRPQDRGHFLTHSESAALPNIGNFGGTWENLDLLLALREAGQLSSGIHTCTIMTNGRDIVTDGFIETFEADLAARVANPAIRWVTLPDTLQIWQSEYGSAANMLTYDAATSLMARARAEQ